MFVLDRDYMMRYIAGTSPRKICSLFNADLLATGRISRPNALIPLHCFIFMLNHLVIIQSLTGS